MATFAKQNEKQRLQFVKNAYLAHLDRKLNLRLKKIVEHSLKEGNEQALKVHKDFSYKLNLSIRDLVKNKIDLSTKTAKTLVLNHLEEHPFAIIGLLIKVLKNIAEHTDIQVNAHPKDAQVLKESRNEIKIACSLAGSITIIADDAISRGSIIVKANKSIIDAQLKTQIDKGYETLTSILNR